MKPRLRQIESLRLDEPGFAICLRFSNNWNFAIKITHPCEVGDVALALRSLAHDIESNSLLHQHMPNETVSVLTEVFSQLNKG